MSADPPVLPWPQRPPRRVAGVPAGLIVCWQAALVLALVALGRPVGHVVALGVGAAALIAVTGSRPRGRWVHEWVLLWLRYLARTARAVDPRQPPERGLLDLAGQVESVTTVVVEERETAVITHAGGCVAVLELRGPDPGAAAVGLPAMLAPPPRPEAPQVTVQLLRRASPGTVDSWLVVRVCREAHYPAGALRDALVNAVRRVQRQLRRSGHEAHPLAYTELLAVLRKITFLDLVSPVSAVADQPVGAERWQTLWTRSLPQQSLAVRSWPGVPGPPGPDLVAALLEADGLRAVSVAARRLRPAAACGAIRAGTEVVALELLVRLAAPDLPVLRSAVRHVQSRLSAAGASVESLDGRQLPGFATTLPLGGFLPGCSPTSGTYPPRPASAPARSPAAVPAPPAVPTPPATPTPPAVPAPPATPTPPAVPTPPATPTPPAVPALPAAPPVPAATPTPAAGLAPVVAAVSAAAPVPVRGQAQVHSAPVRLSGAGVGSGYPVHSPPTVPVPVPAPAPAPAVARSPAVVRAVARVPDTGAAGTPVPLPGVAAPPPPRASHPAAPPPPPALSPAAPQSRAVLPPAAMVPPPPTPRPPTPPPPIPPARAYGPGLFTAGSARPAELEQLLALVRGPQPSPQVVSVISGTGGAGASTTASGVALTLATIRDDYVALLRVPADPVDAAGIAEVCAGHTFVVIDIGAYRGEATARALAASTRVVVVSTADQRAAAATRRTLDQIRQGYPTLVSDAVIAVVSRKDRQFRRVSRGLSEDLTPHASRIVPIPPDPALTTMGGLDLTRLRPETREAYLRLATTLATPARAYSHTANHHP